jgi:hypothetical protein
MAFLIYKKTITEENLRFERVTPLKLSGTDGLIARHVRTLPADETSSWKLETAALLKLAGCEGGEFCVLFDMTGGDGATVCFYELTRIHGSCRDTSTNLALDFNVVLDRELDESKPDFGAVFEAPVAAAPKKLGEMLAVTGGPGGGDWKWGNSAVQLGATVFQPQYGHRPGGGACPRCTSGRRNAQE